MSLARTTNSPGTPGKKGFKTSWTASISKALMWSSFSNQHQTPAAVRYCRYALQPITDTSCKGEEREGTPGGEFLMPISPPKVTDWWTPGTLLKEGLASQDCPKLPIIMSSVATEEGASWLTPWEWTIPGKPCDQAAAATSLQEELGEEGNC